MLEEKSLMGADSIGLQDSHLLKNLRSIKTDRIELEFDNERKTAIDASF